MYSLLYTLIIIGILAFLLSIGLLLYARFSGMPIVTQSATANAGNPDITQMSAH
jgi:hypothetical protein